MLDERRSAAGQRKRASLRNSCSLNRMQRLLVDSVRDILREEQVEGGGAKGNDPLEVLRRPMAAAEIARESVAATPWPSLFASGRDLPPMGVSKAKLFPVDRTADLDDWVEQWAGKEVDARGHARHPSAGTVGDDGFVHFALQVRHMDPTYNETLSSEPRPTRVVAVHRVASMTRAALLVRLVSGDAPAEIPLTSEDMVGEKAFWFDLDSIKATHEWAKNATARELVLNWEHAEPLMAIGELVTTPTIVFRVPIFYLSLSQIPAMLTRPAETARAFQCRLDLLRVTKSHTMSSADLEDLLLRIRKHRPLSLHLPRRELSSIPGMLTSLLPYQAAAVQWMLHRDSGRPAGDRGVLDARTLGRLTGRLVAPHRTVGAGLQSG